MEVRWKGREVGRERSRWEGDERDEGREGIKGGR